MFISNIIFSNYVVISGKGIAICKTIVVSASTSVKELERNPVWFHAKQLDKNHLALCSQVRQEFDRNHLVPCQAVRQEPFASVFSSPLVSSGLGGIELHLELWLPACPVWL